MSADDLLVGPRGRALCLAVAHRIDARVWSAWLQAAWQPGDSRCRDELVAALEAVDIRSVSQRPDPATFLEAMNETVGHARYWQEPDDQDAIAADPAVTAALHRIAAVIATAPATAWWTSGVDMTALRCTRWALEGTPASPSLTGSADRLSRWRQETLADEMEAAKNRPADPSAPYSGSWWSTPPGGLVSTARPLSEVGSAELAWHEDSMGLTDASVWYLETVGPPRVWEIHRAQAWVDLVESYPLNVTHSRRHDWYRTTGEAGAWRIPDWSAVAVDWDGVHVWPDT